jgi:hypothetical protein
LACLFVERKSFIVKGEISADAKENRGEKKSPRQSERTGSPFRVRSSFDPLAFAHFAEHCANAFFGQTGESFFLQLLALQALHCNQKPRGCWLAI